MAKKKNKVNKKDLDPVELIERIPSQNFDLARLSDFLCQQIQGLESDRDRWLKNRSQYLEIIDNFLNYDTGELPFEGAANVHIPVAMEKARATHARFYQAIFAIQPPFFTEPQEKLDAKRLININNLMKWGLSRHVNYYKGINSAVDDSLWNFVTDGWCFLNLRYERKFRKALVVEESQGKKAQPGQTVPTLFKEKEKWIPVYEGPVLENIQNESVLFPGDLDIQSAPCVAIETCFSEHDLNYHAATGFFDEDAVKKVLKWRGDKTLDKDSKKVRDEKGRRQGVKIEDTQAFRQNKDLHHSSFESYYCYCTFDIDGDGFDEELVVYYHRPSSTVLRWTYLDRITSTNRRPIYKSDFIKRPGRQYALGTCELLFGLNREVDAIHNQRLDYGTISNMPFWFYNSGMTLPNEKLEIAPGRGVPVEDTSQILFPTLKSGTTWGFQEENTLFQIVSRLSGISDVNLGIAPTPGDAVRSQGQLAALLNEGNAVLDISLRRYQDMLGEAYGDIHQMYVDKLPKAFQHLVVGDDGTSVADETGIPAFAQLQDTRKEIAGKVHFHIKANTSSGNKSFLRQSRTLLAQQLVNPINLQLGVVTPLNVYEINKALLEVSDEIDFSRFITKPENAPKPLSLADELNLLKQGLLPDIPLNDDHEAKAEAISVWILAPQTQEGLRLGNVNPNAPIVAEAAIAKHRQLAQVIAAQSQAAQNNQGQQLQLGQQAPQLPANTGANNAEPGPQPTEES